MEKKNNMNMVLAVVVVVAVFGVLVFISIHNKTNNIHNSMTDNNSNTNMPVSGDTTDMTPPPDSTTPATPTDSAQVAKAGDTVAMNYTGRLQDGTVFDSNVDPKFQHVQPFVFTLGAGQVIPGWDKGIVGMKVGEKKTLVIPPGDAYGASGQGPIPPNATLTFDVELLAIKPTQ